MAQMCRLAQMMLLRQNVTKLSTISIYQQTHPAVIRPRGLSTDTSQNLRTSQITSSEVIDKAVPTQSNISATEPALPSNLKWEVDDGLTKVIDIVDTTSASCNQVVGAIVPWAQLNIAQKILYPYTYPLMHLLDYLTTIAPWWGAIVLTNVILRTTLLPLTIKQTAVSVRTNNLLPDIQRHQQKLTEAMGTGNHYEIALARTKMSSFFAEHDIRIWDRIWPLLIQAPAFFTMFFLLRQLSNLSSPGLMSGGAFWFTDLTVADPYYLLPISVCVSNLLLLEFGMISKPSLMTPIARWGLRGFSVVLFPIVYSFPSSVVIFWTTSNLLTLGTNLFLKLPKIRKLLKIPPSVVHDPSKLPMTNQTFKGQVQNAMDSGRANRTSQDIRRLDDIAFRKAGVGPLRKTYKHPPNEAQAKT